MFIIDRAELEPSQVTWAPEQIPIMIKLFSVVWKSRVWFSEFVTCFSQWNAAAYHCITYLRCKMFQQNANKSMWLVGLCLTCCSKERSLDFDLSSDILCNIPTLLLTSMPFDVVPDYA